MTENNAQTTPKVLGRILRPVAGRTTLGIVFELIGAASTIIPFIALTQLAHLLVGAVRTNTPVDSGAAMRGVFLFLFGIGMQLGFTALALLVTHFADVDLQAKIRIQLANKMGRLPLGWFDDNSSGRVRHLVSNDVETLHQLVAHSIVETIAAVVTPLVGAGYAFYLDWRLGIISLLPIFGYMVVYGILSAKCEKDMMSQIAAGLAVISTAIVEYVNGMSVLKIFGQTGQGFHRFSDASKNFRKRFRDLVGPAMTANAFATNFLLLTTSGFLVLGFGTWFVRAGWTDPINVLIVLIIAMTLPSTVYTVATAHTAIRDAMSAAGRVVALLDEEELIQPDAATAQVPADNSVSFQNVTFAYHEGRSVIHDVSFNLPAGSITALVGPSGAGKSTLGTLLPRFRDITAGSIKIGGVDLREMTPDTLYDTVGIVLQDVQLLKMSIRDNIALGNPDATDAEIMDAAKVACIHDRIMEFEHGYDTIVGVDAMLSGGEAQRVSIARTILSDTPVLVLDEATSATDPESEADIQKALSHLIAGRTVLVIAHRLTTITEVDNIIVLDQGEIVETGTHQELLQQDGLYAGLWKNQSLQEVGA
ncbi:MAG TPA: ABC transporter ATP-binding protein [Corynebacteriales bacterium]|nr:ABC transporter ATP-binding protein [Mycobacteriales bacterium]